MLKIIAILISSSIFSMCNAHAVTGMDIVAGKKIYAQCLGCHSPGYHRTGPSHCNLVGRLAGSAPGFEYTVSMKNSGIIWTVKNLDQFLENPLQSVPGTSMGFAGIQSKKIRTQLIVYLATLTDENPLCK